MFSERSSLEGQMDATISVPDCMSIYYLVNAPGEDKFPQAYDSEHLLFQNREENSDSETDLQDV